MVSSTIWKLSLTSFLRHGRNLEVERRNLESGKVRLDQLAVQVLLVLDRELDVEAFVGDLVGRLDRVVLEVAMLAGERGDDNVAVEGDAREHQLGSALEEMRNWSLGQCGEKLIISGQTQTRLLEAAHANAVQLGDSVVQLLGV